jgi:hypothetical protein
MTKKDYVKLAKLVTSYRDQLLHPTAPGWVDEHFVRDFVVPLAHTLKADNPAFDYAKFLAACGVRATEAV